MLHLFTVHCTNSLPRVPTTHPKYVILNHLNCTVCGHLPPLTRRTLSYEHKHNASSLILVPKVHHAHLTARAPPQKPLTPLTTHLRHLHRHAAPPFSPPALSQRTCDSSILTAAAAAAAAEQDALPPSEPRAPRKDTGNVGSRRAQLPPKL
jgi:hypothetical protein